MTRPDALGLGCALGTGALLALVGPSPIVLVPAALLVLLLADGVFRPQSSVLAPTIVRGRARGAKVALTFDDGPDPVATPMILDALAAAGARATFFVIGRALEAHGELARRIVASGHELANHSYEHSRLLNFRGPRRMAEEVARGAAAIRRVTGEPREPRPPLYRPPIGLKNPALARVAKRMGLTIVAWSLHARDTRDRDPGAIARRVLSRVRAGDIVLLHDGSDRPPADRRATAAAVAEILAGLRARGLDAVTVSELLAE